VAYWCVPDPFVIGVVGALAMFVIPEKINLRVCRANVFFFSALMAVVAFVILIVFTSRSFTMDELEAGGTGKTTVNF
jgi:hypothetical protein